MRIRGTEHQFIKSGDFMTDIHRLVDYAYSLKHKDAQAAIDWIVSECDIEDDDDRFLMSYSIQILERMKRQSI